MIIDYVKRKYIAILDLVAKVKQSIFFAVQ